MKTFISAHAEHRRSDYFYARQRSDSRHLEKSPPLDHRGGRLLIALIFAFASFAGMTLISLVGTWLLD
jgi:hypothetical protein